MIRLALLAPAVVVSVLAAPAAVAADRYSYAGSERAVWAPASVADRRLPAAPGSPYTIYIGDGTDYRVSAIASDAAGNTYVAGSRSFDAVSTPWFHASNVSDAFVTKLDASGKTVFTATFSGKGTDQALAVALDQAGNIYLAGSTTSPNFPLRNALHTTADDGFLLKLSPDGSRLIYSTYFWGAASAIAVDPDQNVYLTGATTNPAFPRTEGMPDERVYRGGPPSRTGAFIAKVSAAGDRVIYSGILAGHALTCTCCSSCFLAARYTGGAAIALDQTGAAYVAGLTNTTDLPTTPGAFRKTGVGAFVAKVKAAGIGLDYLTYLGPAQLQQGDPSGIAASGIAVDASGNAIVAGSAIDPAFPTTPGAYQTALSNQESRNSDALVVKLAADGSSLVWATYIGGASDDAAQSIALDPAGNVWVAGRTQSPNFPAANGWIAGGDFLVRLTSSGSALSYSARFPLQSAARAISADASGLVHLAGNWGIVSTVAPEKPFATSIHGIQNGAGGTLTGMVAPGEVVAIFGPHIGPSTPASAIADSSGLLPTTLGGVQVLFDDMPAPLLYVSDTQVNAVVPFGVSAKTSARVRLTVNSVNAPEFPVVVVPAMPEIFTTASRYAAALNEDGTINSKEHPAQPGSIVAIWTTGLGAVPARDGEIATAARNDFCCLVRSSYQQIETVYAGAAPGMVAGISQVNFRVPTEFFPSIYITAGGRNSSYASIHVAPTPATP